MELFPFQWSANPSTAGPTGTWRISSFTCELVSKKEEEEEVGLRSFFLPKEE
jgi:hypothetical protein